jgi:N-carbamoyl-L-amino-acid hydrolase
MARRLHITQDRLWDSLMRMGSVGGTPDGGVRRLALTDEDRAARDLLVRWLEEAGCAVRVDDLGTIYGRRPGSDPGAAPVVCGSHLDTVPSGGRFDGALGVLAGLEVIRTLNDAGALTRAPVEVVDWTNEEGARFAPAMLGSGAVCGVFTREEVYAASDADGRSFGEELRRIGYLGDAAHRLRDAAAYLELHVEQGPVLERAGVQVGIVEGVEGISWSRVEVVGRAAHAGPTPLRDRRDALVVAARVILALRALAERVPGVRATVGWLEVAPNTINVVPALARFTVDMRARDGQLLEDALVALRDVCDSAARAEGARARVGEFWRSPPLAFAPAVVDAVETSVRALGYSWTRLWAGAGHDARYVAERVPSAMIFVPSAGGVSHNPEEWTSPEDCARGAQVLLETIVGLAGLAEGDFHTDCRGPK